MKPRAQMAVASIVSFLFALIAGPYAVAQVSVTDQVNAIRSEYRQQHKEAVTALLAAPTRQEGSKLYLQKAPSPARCVERLLALAKTDPKSAGGFEALLAAAEFTDIAWNWKNEIVPVGEVVTLLTADQIDNPRLNEAFLYIKDAHTPPSRELLRRAAAENPDRRVRGQALFYLGADLDQHARLLEIFGELPAFKEGLVRANGEDWVAARTSADQRALRDDAVKFLTQARDQFGDVKIDDRLIRDLSEHMLFRIQRLQIGQTAPDIIGADQDGHPMKLSDYRGRIVAIVFWGKWCSVCMASVPAERDLVKRLQDKPFVLLGVNSDSPDKVNAIISKHQINWRSWADGELDGPQPIARTWNVTSWPEIYLLDAKGVIRYTELAHRTNDKDFDQAINELLAKIQH